MSDLISLVRGRTRISIAPAYGGRIAQIEVHDGARWFPLLYEPDEPLEARNTLAWGSYALVPWPNRIAGGTFQFDGRAYAVPVNHNGHALHGFGYTAAWDLTAHTADACTLALEMPPEWPFPARAQQRIEVFDDGVRQRVTVTTDAPAMPCGTAWHPWFSREAGGHGPLRLRIDADERYELHDMIPTGRILPVAGDFDFRHGPEVGGRSLDDCYRGVRGPMQLRWGEGLALTMRSSANATLAVVYTQHPEAICVEPQTCAIDAFNLAARGDASSGMAVATAARPFMAETEWRWSLT